jgi:hypothetical protein
MVVGNVYVAVMAIAIDYILRQKATRPHSEMDPEASEDILKYHTFNIFLF